MWNKEKDTIFCGWCLTLRKSKDKFNMRRKFRLKSQINKIRVNMSVLNPIRQTNFSRIFEIHQHFTKTCQKPETHKGKSVCTWMLMQSAKTQTHFNNLNKKIIFWSCGKHLIFRAMVKNSQPVSSGKCTVLILLWNKTIPCISTKLNL